MRELNIEFQEQYKRLDKLCRDIYSSSEGVSAYIRDMENTPNYKKCIVYNWNHIFKQLKCLRWKRNQLAHELSIDSDFCTQNDIKWIKDFYIDILNGNDPLALAAKVKQELHKKKEAHNIGITTTTKKTSIWNKIVTKIKNMFS